MPEHADVLSGLYGLRETGLGIVDIATAFGLGLLLAGIFGIAFGLLRVQKTRDPLSLRIAAACSLAEPERAASMAGLLRELTDREAPGEADWIIRAARHFDLDPAMLSRVRAELYKPGRSPDAETLERALVHASARSEG
ncbi:MAG: hypothetical protein AAGH68_07430 [Pseudomonadota bacterium]